MSPKKPNKNRRQFGVEREFIPATAHEVMSHRFPDLGRAIEDAATRVRRAPHWNHATVIPPEAIVDISGVMECLQTYALQHYGLYGVPAEQAAKDADMLGAHAFYMLNFELHHRKLFWVDEPLAWMLDRTRLDIEGSYLRLPFAACAFVFTDPLVMDLCHALTRPDVGPESADKKPRIVTAYLIGRPLAGDVLGVHVRILIDRCLPDKWPYLISRDLHVQPRDRLDALLDSHFPEVNEDELDPFFSSPGLKRLIHLVVNAILYATTAHLDAVVIRSPLAEIEARAARMAPAKARKLTQRMARLSANDVFHLPGRIPISQFVTLRDLEKNKDGRQLLKRFMVRGHWRHAPAHWKDQRLRWIEPYWKGPELAAVIERQYQMKP